MPQNNHDMIESNNLSAKSLGGTELYMRRIYDGFIARDILDKFQIIPSRVRDINLDKFRLYIIQDLHNDPECHEALKDGGWRRFHYVIFVSHWQAQRFIEYYNIPWSKTIVIQNAVSPIEAHQKSDPNEQVNIIYHTTPHRGLNVLLTIWDAVANSNPNIHLDVYSSFKIYGWEDRDKDFQALYDFCNDRPNITYHGSVSNEEVREAQKKAHIFAYPSIWQETSCMCLMEAMSAGLLCIHPDFGALPETAANWTMMYHWHEDIQEHAKIFGGMLDAGIKQLRGADAENLKGKLMSQKSYADIFYSWDNRRMQWNNLLKSIIDLNPPKEIAAEEFVYRS